MKPLRDSTLVNFWLARIGLALLLLVIYFGAWRPLRVILAERLVSPAVQSLSEESNTVNRVIAEGKEIAISYPYNEDEKKLVYSPQAGFILLVAVMGLLFVTLRVCYYGMLLAFHLVVELLVWLMLWLGLQYSVAGYIIAGFLISYFSPVVSLAFVPILYRYKSETADSRRETGS